MYAHSTLDILDPENRLKAVKTYKPGDKIVRKDMSHLSEDQWQELIDSGAIRDAKYPVPDGFSGSPREYYIAQIAQMEDDMLDPSMVNVDTRKIPQLQAQAEAAMYDPDTGSGVTDSELDNKSDDE